MHMQHRMQAPPLRPVAATSSNELYPVTQTATRWPSLRTQHRQSDDNKHGQYQSNKNSCRCRRGSLRHAPWGIRLEGAGPQPAGCCAAPSAPGGQGALRPVLCCACLEGHRALPLLGSQRKRLLNTLHMHPPSSCGAAPARQWPWRQGSRVRVTRYGAHVAWGKGQWPACMGRVRCWVGRAGAWRWAAAAGLAAGAGARLMVCTGPTCRRQAVTSEWLGQGQQQRCVRLGRPALHESTSSARNPPLHLTHTRVTLTTRSGAPAEPRSGRQHPMRVVGLRRAAGMSSKAAAGCWAVTALLPAPADPDATG